MKLTSFRLHIPCPPHFRSVYSQLLASIPCKNKREQKQRHRGQTCGKLHGPAQSAEIRHLVGPVTPASEQVACALIRREGQRAVHRLLQRIQIACHLTDPSSPPRHPRRAGRKNRTIISFNSRLTSLGAAFPEFWPPPSLTQVRHVRWPNTRPIQSFGNRRWWACGECCRVSHG